MTALTTKLFILTIIGILGIIFFSINHMQTSTDDECAVCEWNWYASELYDGHDPGYGLSGPFKDIWSKANYGKYYNLEWLENLRIKYSLTDVRSFTLINYKNPCPCEPNLLYLGTGPIINHTGWSTSGTGYDTYLISYNGSNHSFSNCNLNPWPFNFSSTVHVFRTKWGAWWNMCKEAALYDITIYPDKPQEINISWDEYHIAYQKYLLQGGVDIGSEYHL